ncbi:hypothetical protein PGH26_00870 [Sporosarcina jeotgali]|uniref:YfhD family protein n=1 Tax=Sporosarcina jeotgali TaxID=3020056 RepID=A0ABZ0L044_9BACL|nr:hypothetical protein [Sporosarcina sp. B2O-1]WOV85845.1 hypothetical protein PGH26_00870 [Sporosarcina sp. B2O-1]
MISLNKEEKRKQKAKQLGREEFGYGMDLSPDDFDVIGQNDAAKKKKKAAGQGMDQKDANR